MEQVFRFDASNFSGLPRTTQGGVIIPAALTRVGVLKYYTDSGKLVREFRSPEEVFKADSLATLKGAPVTVGHPQTVDQLVTPANYTSVAKGHVDDVAKADGDYVSAEVRVLDHATLAKVANKELVELSPGYMCKLDWTPGKWNGPNGAEDFDCSQFDIKYNHVAMLPPGRGRSGPNVKLRLDSTGHQIEDVNPQSTSLGEGEVLSGAGVTEPPITTNTDSQDMTPEQIAALQKELADAKTKLTAETLRADAAEAKLKDVPRADAVDGLNARIEVLTGKVADLQVKLDAAESPKLVDAKVQARVALVTEARAHLDSKDKPFSADGMTDHQVRVAVLAKISPVFKCDGRSESVIEGAYAQAIAANGTARSAFQSVQKNTPAARVDEGGQPTKSAYDRNVEASVKAHEIAPPSRIGSK